MSNSSSDTVDHASYDTIDHVTAITDPGERNKDQHLWGDRFMVWVGNVSAWLFPVLMIAIVSQVFLRKAGVNQAWLDDAQWWLYGIAVLAGLGYAVTTDSHVRVDILHAHYSERKKARIEIFGLGWLFLPFLFLMTDIMIHYAYASWLANEGSDSPNGLHGLYILKMSIPFLFGAANIASFAVLYRNLALLYKPSFGKIIIAAFPAIWFAAERVAYYALWWYVHLTKPDLHPRRVSKDALLQDTMWFGLALILIIAAISFWLNRKQSRSA